VATVGGRQRTRAVDEEVFGRDLRAAIPGLKVARPGAHDAADRVRVYLGVRLKDGATS
jgi:hypothetical protein